MTELLHVTFVVPTWNRAELLRQCLGSLLHQDSSDAACEIIVVDDGSTDNTAGVVYSVGGEIERFPIRYVRQKHAGLNAARNAGVRAARGEVVCFLDDDEIIPPGYLVRLRALLLENIDVAGVGGPSRDFGGARARTCGDCSLSASEVPSNGKGPVEALLGGNMAIRQEAFHRVGLFDEELSGRGDESEWFYRARGLSFLYDPELWMWHRRDAQSLFSLCRTAYRQGQSLPAFNEKVGLQNRPGVVRIYRYIGHAVRRRCGRGWVLASREAGSMIAFWKRRIRTPSSGTSVC